MLLGPRDLRRPLLVFAVFAGFAASAGSQVVDTAWDASGSFEAKSSLAPGKFVEVCGKLTRARQSLGDIEAIDPSTSISTRYPPRGISFVMPAAYLHETHPDVIKRLKRAEGHLRTIIGMLESERACVDVAQQLFAVEQAIRAAKKALIHDHIDHCLDRAIANDARSGQEPLGEFKEITKYL